MCDESPECPLCMEALEIDDQSFFPCTCGYQICRFCWHRIRTDENGLCPACRKQYPEDPAEFKPLTEDVLQSIKKERKQKDVQRKQKAAENRKHLANVRVVQRNLVFVVGLSPRLSDPEVLKKHEYFGKFGKIHKVVINQSTSYAGSQVGGPSASAYVTYIKPEDALQAILTVNNVHVEGRTLKTSLGTTKYCSHFLKGSQCQKSDCMYLHELGEEAASFTKDEMQAGKHQEYEQMLIEQFLNAQNSANNHHISNIKIKKPVQAIENPEVLPSLMDMTGDIKHTLPQSGPLLPNPVPLVTAGGGQTNGHAHLNNCGWPVLDSAPSANGKADHLSNSRVQKSPFRTTTPPGSNGSRAVGTGRQRGSNSTNSSDEIHIPSPNPMGSSRSLSSSPPDGELDEEITSENPPLPPSPPTDAAHTAGIIADVSSGGLSPQHTHIDDTGLPPLQSPEPPSEATLSNSLSSSLSNGLATSLVGAIGSNRRSGLPDEDATTALSFFGSALLPTPGLGVMQDPMQIPTPPTAQDIPNVTLPSSEMADAIPVSTTTDWSAAFGFNNHIMDGPQDDDLGFDPCAESFKGLADLIEKENDMQQQQQQSALGRLHHHPTHPHGLNDHLGFPRLSASPPSTLSSQGGPAGLVRSLPPGFSISQIQQQQQQHFFTPEVTPKLLDLLPQFPPVSRFPLHAFPGSYHASLHSSLEMDAPHTSTHTHAHTMPHTAQPSQNTHTQNDAYSMKDMQEQLRSMLPNINISFGALPQSSQSQSQAQSHTQTHAQSHTQTHVQTQSLYPTQQHSAHLNKSWPLSSSPDAWNDPAIVSTSQFSEPAASVIPETAPHWLKSLQQLTESDGPTTHSHLAWGWPAPHHTHAPPPGFPGLASHHQAGPDAHQMAAEVLQ